MARRTGTHAGINGTVKRSQLKPSQPPTDDQLMSSAARAAAINSHNLTPKQRDFLAWREQRKLERQDPDG